MQSFTYMSDEGIAAMLSKMTTRYTLFGEEYKFTLNAREYSLFRKAIDFVADNHPNGYLSAWAEVFGNSFASPEFVLNHETFVNVVYSLRYVWFNASLTQSKNVEVATWAGDFLSNVAESLGVEFV